MSLLLCNLPIVVIIFIYHLANLLVTIIIIFAIGFCARLLIFFSMNTKGSYSYVVLYLYFCHYIIIVLLVTITIIFAMGFRVI